MFFISHSKTTKVSTILQPIQPFVYTCCHDTNCLLLRWPSSTVVPIHKIFRIFKLRHIRMAEGQSVVGFPDSRLLSQTHFRFTNFENM
jgi:hypothetical protein